MTSEQSNEIKGARVGVVESDGRDKTRKVVIQRMARHPKYAKYIRKRTVLHVHDENNESRNGDRVEVAPCRPVSKTKSWKIVRIVERGIDLRVVDQGVPGDEQEQAGA